MAERILLLTYRKVLLMAAIFVFLLFFHVSLNAIFRVDEPILFLGAALVIPVWAICAAVYTLDRLTFPPHRFGKRHPG